MELKLRKLISNIPKYEGGKISFMPATFNNMGSTINPNGINFGSQGVAIPLDIPKTVNIPNTIDASKAYSANKSNPGSIGNAANIITTGVNFVGAGINDFQMDRKTGEIIADSGARNINAGGFSWRKQNAVDEGKEMSDLHKLNVSNTLGSMGTGAAFGAAVGSIFPGAGTVIGGAIGAIAGLGLGLLGGGSRHKKMRKQLFAARKQIENNNNMAFAGAQGDYLAQQYNLNNAYTQDDELYVAKYGKSCMGLMKPRKR